MLIITGMLEDTCFTAEREEATWRVKVQDNTYGETTTYQLTDEQFGACLALASAGDFENGELNKAIWAIAEKAMPGKIRIIP